MSSTLGKKNLLFQSSKSSYSMHTSTLYYPTRIIYLFCGVTLDNWEETITYSGCVLYFDLGK